MNDKNIALKWSGAEQKNKRQQQKKIQIARNPGSLSAKCKDDSRLLHRTVCHCWITRVKNKRLFLWNSAKKICDVNTKQSHNVRKQTKTTFVSHKNNRAGVHLKNDA